MNSPTENIESLDNFDETSLENNGWTPLNTFLDYKKAIYQAQQSILRASEVGLRTYKFNGVDIWEVWSR